MNRSEAGDRPESGSIELQGGGTAYFWVGKVSGWLSPGEGFKMQAFAYETSHGTWVWSPPRRAG